MEKIATRGAYGEELARLAADYPELPAVAFQQGGEENKNGVTPAIAMDGPILKEMIETTIYAVSQDDKKPANNGEKFVLESDKLTLVALDGFRLAICERPVTAGREVSIVIPAKTLNEVARLIGDSDEAVAISASKRYVVFTLGGYTVISRLLDDAFLDYKKTINPSHLTRVVVGVKEFSDAIERASLMAKEGKNNLIRMKATQDNLKITSMSELGDVLEDLDAHLEGEDIEIAFNARYISDVIKNVDEDCCTLCMNTNVSPCVISPLEGDSYLYLVLPVRVYN